MAKFSTKDKVDSIQTSLGAPRGPGTTIGLTFTYEGGLAYVRDPNSEFVITAATNMVGEDTFYEKGSAKDERFRQLIWDVTQTDPDFPARFIPYLRNRLQMRSATVVVAIEAALARRHFQTKGAAITTRRMVDSACVRTDDIAEGIAYYKLRTGKNPSGGVQRGFRDAIQRLYTERNALKYDGIANAWRMMDVVAVIQPTPQSETQRDLFNYLADRRWNRDEIRVTNNLSMIGANRRLMVMEPAERRQFFLDHPEELGRAGMTWEAFSSLGAMDKAAWEVMIPHMGYMALLRNLRNFDQAGVSDEVAAMVAAKLSDPQEVARSRQFPYRFLSAQKHVPSQRWGHALDLGLLASTSNIPVLPGRSLVLVDTSASMGRGDFGVSTRSTMAPVEIAALFGCALAQKSDVELRGFADKADVPFQMTKGGSLLRDIQSFCGRIGKVGHGTEMVAAIRESYQGRPPDYFNQVFLISDMQAFQDPHASGWWSRHHADPSTAVPANVPLFGMNLSGYKATSVDASKPYRYEIGGFSDALFTMVSLLIKSENADWPF